MSSSSRILLSVAGSRLGVRRGEIPVLLVLACGACTASPKEEVSPTPEVVDLEVRWSRPTMGFLPGIEVQVAEGSQALLQGARLVVFADGNEDGEVQEGESLGSTYVNVAVPSPKLGLLPVILHVSEVQGPMRARLQVDTTAGPVTRVVDL